MSHDSIKMKTTLTLTRRPAAPNWEIHGQIVELPNEFIEAVLTKLHYLRDLVLVHQGDFPDFGIERSFLKLGFSLE